VIAVEPRRTNTNTPLNIGVIGFGRRAYLTASAHREDLASRVVACADPVEAARGKFQAQYGPDAWVTDDYHALLARPDLKAVFVLSPDFLHEEHAVAALEAGKAVYLEKPMATSIEGCDRILRTAMRNGSRLYVGHNMRHMSVMFKMKQLIDSGVIGEVRAGWCRHFVAYGGDAYFKDWHAERSKANSLLLQKGTHDIDLLHWFCGGHTIRTSAMGNLSVYNRIQDRHAPGEYGDTTWSMSHWPPLSQQGLNPVVDVEDLSMMLMELNNGVLCSYQQCHYTPDAWRSYTIVGTEGRLENFNDVPGGAVIRVWNRRTDYNAQGDEQYLIPEAEGGHGGADPLIVEEFLHYVRHGGSTVTSPVAARHSVAAGCMAAHSLRHGSIPVDVPPLDREVQAYFDAPAPDSE